MATKNIYTNLLGYDPYERQLQDRKLWAGLYGSASSPYEKIGIGLAQIGGTLFGNASEDENKDPLVQLTKLSEVASQQFPPNSAEYFRYIAENSTNPMVKQNAAQKALEAESVARKETREDVEFISKRPEQLATELQTLTTRLENRAKLAGWSGEGEVSPEIQAKLEKTPEYKKILQLSNAGQEALIDRSQKEEKESLTLKSIKTTIAKNEAQLKQIGTDLDAGMRWNMEREAAIELFIANGLDYTNPLDQATALMNPSLVAAQQKALRKPWQGGKQQAPIKLQ
jgi:hypothetical protein